ncbi:hypothetical protein MKZ38_005925 [Zalerion maritima]|uniref:Centrosomin N-terminal motif 1 domain-containing protein n=1 Tax=Zalerion maritima TaxID=339359 RepID=A0AAD5WUL5_9PEZI|nr:hypothetical protein MKZ38_005925 [Zalerion maritima]
MTASYTMTGQFIARPLAGQLLLTQAAGLVTTTTEQIRQDQGRIMVQWTISKLHNENFNLKLEVYHRREREVALEERVQKLEAELSERDQIESSLRTDLVNRDTEIKTQTSAVQEAVNVIMDLEAKLEKYRQGGCDHEDDEAAPSTPTPASRGPSRLEDEITTLARMPSFVSDLSANTENLRNVYLSNQGSALNLARGDVSDARGPSYTPSLSILDEIYGDVRQPRFEAPNREQTPVRELPVRKTKEEKRQAIEKALGDMPHATRQARYEKRESLHPVLTGMPMGRDILPPTPDTMTSSTLGRGRGSKDTLSQQPSIQEAPEKERVPHHVSLSNPSAAPSVTAFNDRKSFDPIQRPRSASEATTAPRWDMSDTESMESDVDIWLRERGRASPDLFSFPSTGPRWDSDQMFGIASATSTLTKGPAPPPPNRRSSLQARTSTPGRPRTRGTPSIVRSDRFNDFFDNRDGATPPPIQLKRIQVEAMPQPDDEGGVLLKDPHNPTPPTTAVPQPVTAPTTPTGPTTPSSGGHKRRWFGLGRVGSLRKG